MSKNLARIRWQAVLSSVRFEVKSARMELAMAHLGCYRQQWIDTQRAWEQQVAEQYAGMSG